MELTDCYVDTENGRKWFHEKLGDYLIEKMHIYRGKDDTVRVYHDGIYINDNAEILRAVQRCRSNSKETFRREVLKYIEIEAPLNEKPDNYNLIGCANGVFDISNGRLYDYNSSMFLNHKIAASFDRNAKCEAVDSMLDKITCHKTEVRRLLEEFIGYTLYRNCRFQKICLLRGFGRNGKSTLLNAITNMIGEENVSALSLNNLQDKFKKAELQDKLANICDDLSNAYIKETEDFKAIATGGIMTMERKCQQPFKYRNYAKLILAGNEIPKSADKTEGYYRRFLIIPLDAKLSNQDADYDPNIDDKLATEEAKSYLLLLALRGLKRLLKRGYFEDVSETEAELKTYKADNDPIIAFVGEYTEDKIIGKATDDIFNDFCEWYRNENNKQSTYTKTTFSRTLSNVYGITTLVKSKKRIYIKETDKNVVEKYNLTPSDDDDEKLPF